jgi:hypothetical protein
MKIPGLLLGLLCAHGVSAQGFWATKPFQEWSPKECRKLLEDSPWARQHTISRVLIESLTSAPTDRARESNPRLVYTIQFRTARPVRQAMVREGQIAQKYETLSAAQRTEFDRSADTFLAQAFPDTVIVLVEYSVNIPSYQSDLERLWSTRTEAWARNEIFLITDDGRKVPPLRFTSRQGGGAFQVIFPRTAEGRPVVSTTDKELKIEFPHPAVGILTESRVLEVFKVSKMLVGEKVEF